MRYLKIENKILVGLSFLIAVLFFVIYFLHVNNGFYNSSNYKRYEEILVILALIGIIYIIASVIFFLFYFSFKRIKTKNSYYNLPLKRYLFLIVYGILTIVIFGLWMLIAEIKVEDSDLNTLVYDNMQAELALSLSFIQFVFFKWAILLPITSARHHA